MMNPENDLDCVALKNEIQRQMHREFQGLFDEDQRARIRQELETSDTVAARKWRQCRNAETAANPASVA